MEEARRTGAEPVAALIAGGLVEESVYYRALGRHLSLPYEEADGIEIRPGSHYPESILSGVVPVRLPSGRDGWMIAPSARRIEDLLRLARLGRLPRQHLLLTRPSALAAAVRVHHAAQVARLASHTLADGDERLSARTEATGWQKATASLFAVMVLFALTYGGLPWAAFCGLCGIILAAAILLRIFATAASFDPVGRRPRALADRELPFYTVSIALCREEEVLDQLIAAMEALDYPAAKVEIKLIVEADDAGLIAAIAARNLPARYEMIIAPQGFPRTKPRALNMALPTARGELLVVFDAEDRPEPQQLRRAAERFAISPPQLACLQASLVIDNWRDSWLTRLFALEYAMLFDVLNPGLAALAMPIPLGGTSNHFRVRALRDAMGWDAWNVTEDIDLGLRLARRGYNIETLACVTDEEAPATIVRWLNQRRRWMKGWLQTLATHSCHPALLARELGLLRASACLAMVAGGVIGPLLGPLFGSFAVYDALYGNLLDPPTWTELAQSTCWLFVGVAGVISAGWPAILGLRRRGLRRLAPCLLLLPAYYGLLTVVAWGALIEFFTAPYHWSKTPHGFARTSSRQTARTPMAEAPASSQAISAAATPPETPSVAFATNQRIWTTMNRNAKA